MPSKTVSELGFDVRKNVAAGCAKPPMEFAGVTGGGRAVTLLEIHMHPLHEAQKARPQKQVSFFNVLKPSLKAQR